MFWWHIMLPLHEFVGLQQMAITVWGVIIRNWHLKTPSEVPKTWLGVIIVLMEMIQEDGKSLVPEPHNLPAVCSSAIGANGGTFVLGSSVKFVGIFTLLLHDSAWSYNGGWWVSMGIGITAPLVTIRPVENRMADLGGVMTKNSVTLKTWLARSPCAPLSIFTHWASLLWAASVLNLDPLPPMMPQSHGFCNWPVLKSTSWQRCVHWNFSCLWVCWSWKFASSLASLLCPGWCLHYGFSPHWLHYAQTHPISSHTCILHRTAWECYLADHCRVLQSHCTSLLMTCLKVNTWGHVYDSVGGQGKSVLACFIMIVDQLFYLFFFFLLLALSSEDRCIGDIHALLCRGLGSQACWRSSIKEEVWPSGLTCHRTSPNMQNV